MRGLTCAVPVSCAEGAEPRPPDGFVIGSVDSANPYAPEPQLWTPAGARPVTQNNVTTGAARCNPRPNPRPNPAGHGGVIYLGEKT